MVEVDVVEIKSSTRNLHYTRDEVEFIKFNPNNGMIMTEEGGFLDGPAQNDSYHVERRRAVHYRDGRTGKDKFIIWSPEFEQFIGRPLRDLERLGDVELELSEKTRKWQYIETNLHNVRIFLKNEESSHDKTKDRLKFWQGVACRYEDRVENMRKDAHACFLFGMAGVTIGLCSVASWWLT